MSTSTTSGVSVTSGGSAQVTGLVSGIDTTSIVDSIMKVEAQPQTALKTKLTTNQAKQAVLTTLNATLASLTTAAAGLADGTTSQAMQATSSSAAVTATVTGTPAGVSLSIDAAAKAVVASTVEVLGSGSTASDGWVAPATNDSVNSPKATFTFTLTAPGGATYTLTAATPAAADVADVIIKSTNGVVGTPPVGPTGVSAAIIVDGAGKQHLSLTGAPSTTSTTVNDPIQEIKLTWNDLSSPPASHDSGYTNRTNGTPAQLTLNGVPLRSSTNTFVNAIDGLSLTLNPSQFGGATAPAVSVTTTLDAGAVAKNVSTAMATLQSALSSLKLQLTSPPPGVTPSATAGGLFAGDSNLLGVYNALSSALAEYAGQTVTASSVGTNPAINLDVNGAVSVDTTAMTKYLTSNPAGAISVLQGLGTKLKAAAKDASSPTLGTITQQISNFSSTTSQLTKDISAWDDRLQQRRATLSRQYQAMEVALQKLQSQSQTLTQQLNALDNSKD